MFFGFKYWGMVWCRMVVYRQHEPVSVENGRNLIALYAPDETELSYFCIRLKPFDNRIACFVSNMSQYRLGSEPQFKNLLPWEI